MVRTLVKTNTQAAISVEMWTCGEAAWTLMVHADEVQQMSKKLLSGYSHPKSNFYFASFANLKCALKIDGLQNIFLKLPSFLSAALSAYL